MANKAPIFLLLRLQAAAAAAISCCPGGVSSRSSKVQNIRVHRHAVGAIAFGSKNLHLAGSPNSTDLSDLI